MNFRRLQLVPLLLVAAQVLAAWASSAHHHHHGESCSHEHVSADHTHDHCHAGHAHAHCHSHDHGDHRHQAPADDSAPPADHDHDHEHCTLCKLLAQSLHIDETDGDLSVSDLVVALTADAPSADAVQVSAPYRSRAPPAIA